MSAPWLPSHCDRRVDSRVATVRPIKLQILSCPLQKCLLATDLEGILQNLLGIFYMHIYVDVLVSVFFLK